MSRLLFLILMLVTAYAPKSFCQVNEVIDGCSEYPPKLSSDPNHVYEAVEYEPNFPGGIDKFHKLVTTNLRKTGFVGKVYVSFIVEKNGSLSGVTALNPYN